MGNKEPLIKSGSYMDIKHNYYSIKKVPKKFGAFVQPKVTSNQITSHLAKIDNLKHFELKF